MPNSKSDPHPDTKAATPILLSAPTVKQAGQRSYWGQLYGSSDALAIAEAAQSADAPVVVVTADTPSAQRL